MIGLLIGIIATAAMSHAILHGHPWFALMFAAFAIIGFCAYAAERFDKARR